MGTIHLYGKTVENFKRLLLWSLLVNVAQISCGGALGWLRDRKIAKMVAVCWPRWPPCPYMVKTFKNLLLQNQECLRAELLHKSSRIRGLPVAKIIIVHDLFTARSSLLPYAFLWAPYICMGKLLRISINFSSEASWPMLLKFHVEPP